jgi:fibronectin type 3 domain-containing protein
MSGAGFSVNGISTGLILSPGASATMNVIFAPAASGSVTGSVTIASNASNSPLTISFSGTGVVVTHSATLAWTASTSVVAGYNVYRSSISGGPYTKLNFSPDVSTTFTDSSIVSGQTYYYVVTAVDSNNVESIYSNQVTAVIP